MSINKTLLKDDRRTSNIIKQQSRFIRELKTPQPIGADILKVEARPGSATPAISSGPLLAGQVGNFRFLFQPPITSILTMVQAAFTIYVDPTSFDPVTNVPDAAHQYPAGASLTAGQVNLASNGLFDWADSTDATNSHMYQVVIRNNDTVTHTYYVALVFYVPSFAEQWQNA